MKNFKREIVDAYKSSPDFICILTAIVIFLTDILTGEHIHFPIFFVVPVGLAAWQSNKALAYSMAVALPCSRIFYFYIFDNGKLDSISIINALIIVVALNIYAYLITKITEEMPRRD